MRGTRLLGAIGGVFAALTGLFVLLGLFVTPVALALAVPFGATAYFLWYHASGRLADRVAANAGGRRRRRRDATTGPRGRRDRTREPRQQSAPDRGDADAYRALGLDPGADAESVEAAYREKVKEVHPDRGGDERAFREVREAYERLADP
ncbi:MAG: J domain-containing protein [Halobacteriaceae archaeon]